MKHLLTIAAGALAIAVSSAVPGHAGAAPSVATEVFAPYVDVTLYPTFQLIKNAPKVGHFYTLAFITSEGTCTAAWGGVIPVTQGFLHGEITTLRANGGNVIASFGGAAGTELAQSCTDLNSLVGQYQSAISEYAFTAIDFDVEGAAIGQQQSIDLRNKAIAALQAANPALHVSYTLPVLPSGLTQDGVNLLANAISNGARVDVVNVMTMDYGRRDNHMGQDALDAANSLYTQLALLYPNKTPAQLYAMIGITPMIGKNDTPGETFTLADARMVSAYAAANGIGLVAMWSANRDRPCHGAVLPRHIVNAKLGRGRAVSDASPTCSGIQQRSWAFSKIFRRLN